MLKSGLIERPKRKTYTISNDGLQLLAAQPKTISLTTLENYPAYVEWRNQGGKRADGKEERNEPPKEFSQTPYELVEKGAAQISKILEDDVLDRVRNQCTPAFLERLVVELMIKMGYG